MTVDPGALLRQLSSQGRIGLAGGSSGAPSAPIEGASFAELLERVRDGSIRAGDPIEVDESCGVMLSDDDLARLSLAADKAESLGVRTALVYIGDRQFTLDVASRTLKAGPGSDGPVTPGVDGVIDLRPVQGQNSAAPADEALSRLAHGAGIAAHPGIARALRASA